MELNWFCIIKVRIEIWIISTDTELIQILMFNTFCAQVN